MAEEHPEINNISDLIQAMVQDAKEHRLVTLDTEFANRSDGLVGMVKLYDMNLTRKNTRQMDAGLVYTTDGRLNAFKLKLLADDCTTSRTTPPRLWCVGCIWMHTRNWPQTSSPWPYCSTTKPCAS